MTRRPLAPKRRVHRARPDDERGIALIMAVLTITVMTLLAMAVANAGVGQLPSVRYQQQHEEALEAANAGTNDFLSYLNANTNYWDDTTAWPSNPAFSSWVPVPGASNSESFRYSVDSSTINDGYVTIQSSGCSSTSPSASACTSGVVRTVDVEVRPTGFLDFVYFTNYEISDPNLVGGSSCTPYHAWESNGNGGSLADKYGPTGCSIISFGTGDTLDGPVHSNDAFHICGSPTFEGTVDSYYDSPQTTSSSPFGGSGSYLYGPAANRFASSQCDATPTPTFAVSGDPVAGQDLTMPTANTALATDASVTGGDGCLFSGATTLSLYYSSGGTGYISYSSPYTVFTTAAGWNTTLCGTPSTTSPGSGTITVPSTGLVLYDQAVPATSSEYNSCGSSCDGDVTIGNSSTPPAGDTPGLAGQLTVDASDSMSIDNNVTYANGSSGTDLLGLIATNDIEVLSDLGLATTTTTCSTYQSSHGCTPTTTTTTQCASTGTTSFCQNPTIDAAILAIQGSFYVQDYSTISARGDLTVDGSIAQNYRGPVATSSSGTGNIVTGFVKDYIYDARLKYSTPPYFLAPSASSWEQLSWGEISPTSNPCSSTGYAC